MIIAEIGQNHMGDMNLAKLLIREAGDNGADLVKFQLYNHNILYKDRPDVPDVALSFEQAKMLFDYGEEVGIEVFFSVFDVEKVQWCEEIGVKKYKLAARTIYDKDLQYEVGKTGKPVILSYHCTEHIPTMNIENHLYCISDYPTKLESIDFLMMESEYDGFSDHTVGFDAAKLALARGAKIIEKHFCIDHDTGIDAEWSMTPDELHELKGFEEICQQSL